MAVSSVPAGDEKPAITPVEYFEEKDTRELPQVDQAVHKSLLRKLDYRMMPVFFVMYFLNHCQFSQDTSKDQYRLTFK